MISNHKANVQWGWKFRAWLLEILCQIRIYLGGAFLRLCVSVLILWPELEFIYFCRSIIRIIMLISSVCHNSCLVSVLNFQKSRVEFIPNPFGILTYLAYLLDSQRLVHGCAL